MELTVLGKSPAWSDAGGACSGYLVADGETRLLVDCGNGVFGKLRERVSYAEVDAVVITHLHGDHLLDLVPFAYALTYGPAGVAREGKPRLLAPAGARAFFDRLDGTWNDEGVIAGSFDLEEYEAGAELAVGGVAVGAHSVPHVGATHAISLTTDSGRIVCGADGRYSTELIEAAAGADLLLAEATLADPPATEDVHMSAVEAGRLAAAAGVGRLVLIHISDELDADRALAQARSEFQGPVEVASEGATFGI